jgi:hypothetical protein
MNKQLHAVIFIVFLFLSVLAIQERVNCQTVTPNTSGGAIEPTPTEGANQATSNLLLIGGIIAVSAVVVGVGLVMVVKRRVSEKSLRKFSSQAFEDWVIKKFDGKPSDSSSGINGLTQGGQPLLIKQSDHVSFAEIEDFVKLLVRGKAQKGTIVAFNFDNDSIEGKVTAMDNGIELQMLRITELLNKRYRRQIESIARSQVAFDAPTTYVAEDYRAETQTFEKMPTTVPSVSGVGKPRIFISNSNTKVSDQVKRMLDFLHYEYVVGDKEETTVPISNNKFGLMKDCDCAIINIAAAEQERRYSGLYVLNSNVISEINAAYLKYNTQVILLVEKKVELPPNFKGLKRIGYDSDDLSFNAAMDLEKELADFKKISC